ncbi:MAG: hypothetical protein JRN62_02650 [Nitrososphaerota archaeon]|nr:hypothetical protein [Nitrososphaerota archaeon]MDG6948899.1 hypothetical protein [Nitrososphaerota archaeon]
MRISIGLRPRPSAINAFADCVKQLNVLLGEGNMEHVLEGRLVITSTGYHQLYQMEDTIPHT